MDGLTGTMMNWLGIQKFHHQNIKQLKQLQIIRSLLRSAQQKCTKSKYMIPSQPAMLVQSFLVRTLILSNVKSVLEDRALLRR